MKIQQFLEHHGIERNPFADEDAQTDPVFKESCINSTYHPSWDKIYGDPSEPNTSIVFGEKGAGKTAMRLQIAEHLSDYNAEHPDDRAYVVEYDDFNPFLDQFRTHYGRHRRVEKILSEYKLWDHMDAILALGVTQLIDNLLDPKHSAEQLDPRRFDRRDARDLLLLAAFYDRSTTDTVKGRWQRLRSLLGFSTWKAQWDLAVGVVLTVALIVLSFFGDFWSTWLGLIWPYPIILGAIWAPWCLRWVKRWWMSSRAVKQMRVLSRDGTNMRQLMMNFSNDELSNQPTPTKSRTDDRYELLAKLQNLLKRLGYTGMIVLVDRVDEPDLIGGSSERMKAFLWPMFDNKFLKQPGVGFKLLLPVELSHYIDRADRDFYQRARLDKQNLIRSLEWTGEALYDVANARLRACVKGESNIALRQLFDESINDRRLLDTLREMRVPRHLFKFMYMLLVSHSNAHTEDAPVWRINSETFETTLALFRRDQSMMERGMNAV